MLYLACNEKRSFLDNSFKIFSLHSHIETKCRA